MKTALIVLSNESVHLISALPYLLKKGGYRVTVISYPFWSLTQNPHIDEFIKSSDDPRLILEQLAGIIRESNRSFNLTILGTDQLIWTLLDSEIDPLIQEQLYPIANLSLLEALQGKIGVAAVCKKLGILAPPSKVAQNHQEALEASLELGFPVMLKVSRSGAGEGVFKCHDPEEVLRAPILFKKPILVEKYIEGDLISVEPLFLQSHLRAYNYAKMTYSLTPFSPSLERIFMPCPEVEPILQKLGRELQMSGFANISFIRERTTKHHYLFELDFRPNRWISYGQFVGVDWINVLKDPFAPLQKPTVVKELRHFPSDLWNGIKTKNWRRILYWLSNRNSCWKLISSYHLNSLICGVFRLLKRRN